MKNYWLVFFFYCLSTLNIVHAQQTGKVDYKVLGISFTIPDGWVGQEGDGVFLMGSQTIPGVIILTTNEAKSIEQMKQEARVGIADQNGTNLQMLGNNFESVGSNGIGTVFVGTAEWQPAKAYVAGLVNPYGSSVSIIAMTLKDQYSEAHKKAALAVAQSVQFKKPVYGPIVQEWKEKLSGTRLTYMNSYSSVDYSNPNYTSGGGYSDKEVIDLCPQGYFNHSSSSQMSLDVPGATASSRNNGAGAGTWKVIANTSGQAVLQLNFYNQQVYEYTLSMDGDKTMMNSKRYFRTWTGENQPICN